jgi:hypothetical protein
MNTVIWRRRRSGAAGRWRRRVAVHHGASEQSA